MAVARVDNLSTLWILLIIGGFGIGGIVVPASIITTIICPDDLIATIAALTLAIRVIGGAIGYAVYYNVSTTCLPSEQELTNPQVFVNKFTASSVKYIGGAMVTELGITSPELIKSAIEITAVSLIDELRTLPGIAGNETAYQIVVAAGQMAYAAAYKYVYYASIAFGSVSIVAALFLGDISKYMDDHVAVMM